ncbi:ankyrin-3-like isoform X8 [Penaeus indicus]|uniref:ankyrin-3-like isoform X8 n=1 Tax=Penaeus indicus TaxID=29960 RepID=UPI00300C1986
MGAVLLRAIGAGDVSNATRALDHGASPDGHKNDAKKPIHLATENGSLAIIELLCTRGADVNVRDPTNAGRAPLHIAIRKNSPDIVKLLLEKQARPNVADGTGATPLHTAIDMNDITSAGLLLKYKANVHLKDASHNLPLHIAVRKNNCEIVNMLLNAGASVHIVDASGDWLLHVAARFASTRILEKLKEKGCEVNKRNADGSSPLHLAAESGNLEAVKWFTHNGAKLDVLDGKKKTPEDRAVGAKQKRVVQWINDQTGLRADRAKVNRILVKGDVEALRQLIQHHDIDALCTKGNNKGLRAVHYTAIGGHVEMLNVLKENQFDLQAATQQGLTALHYAVRYDHLDAVKWLVTEAGLTASLRDNNGNSALDMAGQAKKERIQEYLRRTAQGTVGRHRFYGFANALPTRTREGGQEKAPAKDLQAQLTEGDWRRAPAPANPPRRPVEGEREKGPAEEVDPEACVKEALSSGDFKNVIKLIEKGTDVDTLIYENNDQGMRAVHYAAQSGNMEMLRALKQSKVDLKPVTRKGFTALHCAVLNGQLDAVRWLVAEAGLDTACRSKGGETALELAKTLKRTDISNYLQEETTQRARRQFLIGRRRIQEAAQAGLATNGFKPQPYQEAAGQPVIFGRPPTPAATRERGREREGPREMDAQACVKEALSSGDFKNVIKLIEKGTDVDTLIYENNDQGMRAVHYAAQSGNMEMLRALKQSKVDLKPVTRKGFTALHCAVLNGQLDAVRWLVAEAGLDTACRSKGGETALDLAKTLKRTEISVYLDGMTQKTRGVEGLTLRPDRQQRRLREDGPLQDLILLTQNPRGAEGLTLRPDRQQRRLREDGPMQDLIMKQAKEAVRAGDVLRVRGVVRRGFNVDTEFQEVQNKGWRLLHFAADRGHTALVEVLIQENANVNAAAQDGMTPLHLASWGGHTEVIRALLSNRANGNAKTTEGMTAIHFASMGGHVSSMEALTPTCGVVSVNCDGKSALHLAAEYGNLSAVQWLHLQGLDFSSNDNKGWTPLQYAKDEGHKKVVEFLEKLEKQQSPRGLTQHEKELKDLQAKLKAKETEIHLLNMQQDLKDRMQERAQAQIKNELQEMREILKAQNDMIARLQDKMVSRGELEKEEEK